MNSKTFHSNDQNVLFELHDIMDANMFRVFCTVHCKLKQEDIDFCSNIRSCGRVAEAVERSSHLWTIKKLREFLEAAKTMKHYGMEIASSETYPNEPCQIRFPTTS